MAGKRFRSWKWIVLWVIVALIVVFALMQAVPYGRSHTNPAASNPFKWTDPKAEALAKKACYDCHSNETNWWWATNIAPFSWLVQADVDGGRARFNLSNYDGRPSVAGLQEALNDGMPPFQYTLLHPSAKLSDADKKALVDGYSASAAANGGASSGGGEGEGGQTTTTAGTGTSGTTGSTGTTAGTGSSTTAADAAGTAAINQACTRCHGADLSLNYHAANEAQANALIDNMVQRGAQVTPEQRQALVKYFTR
jgi:hypothetical protein